MKTTIPASEFTRNFGHYRMVAQRETVAVSSHGRITGYFIAPDEYERGSLHVSLAPTLGRPQSYATGIDTRPRTWHTYF
ncbi:type II toxin-antitoxin system Phd/YefM family antitoxin [Niveispirillum cyanobacteriorum]|uniref:type II toxin-antitoxin system Phd/YefM family antitoxin n=1 Tax=Niveispirillum cyanobacteriorum TaxID=1612173 RepID=UPI00166E6518|nr:type II toxin-antitoxin system Phd/YefM family antitoxin [Niveispirillum cyanobacteriorum]GGE47068.1 hypothetical protein GCM10011317_01800 [Niveispirillum cyanobacteriorum]